MQVKLSSNQYDIVASGMAYFFEKDADLTMNIEADNGYQFSVVVRFQENSSQDQEIEKEIKENTIFLTCYNFKESGTGLSEPAQIAVIDGKRLFITFWSYLDGNEKKSSR